MIEKIFAVMIFVLIIGGVIVNSLFLQSTIDLITSEVVELSINSENALKNVTEINDNFKKKESLIALTVNHNDLTNIEDCFAELTGYLSVGDSDGAEVTKHRLICFLEHLRRLVGFNIDTII